MLLARQGALLTAGRAMVGLKAGALHVIRRSPPAWVAAIAPIACVLAIGMIIAVLGWLAQLAASVVAVEAVLVILAVLFAIPCGLLAFGALVAVPLGWAALVNEGDPDALDSLSRGYEYLFRRPLQLVLYTVLSLGILVIVGSLASAVASSATHVATNVLELTRVSPRGVLLTEQVLQLLPISVMLTLLWSLVGGV